MAITTNEIAASGVSVSRLERVKTAIRSDIEKDFYDGAVIIVSRNGKILIDEAIGYAHRDSNRPMNKDDIFCLFSISKSLTATVVLDRIEKGDFLLTTPIAEIIPEYATNGKDAVAIYHLLSHTGGLPTEWPNLPPDKLGNLEVCVDYICKLPLARPLGMPSYNPVYGHYILAEVVRRVDGGKRKFWQIMEQDLFQPLKMHSTSLGRCPGTEERIVPLASKDLSSGMFSKDRIAAKEASFSNRGEVPAAGVHGTAGDIWRFAEMLRRGGELDGTRILSPAMIRLATQNHTGEGLFENFAYANYTRHWQSTRFNAGLGFISRGDVLVQHSQHGSLASPAAFGHKGLGTTNFWVDPTTGVSFVCLTAGIMEETYSWDRWQRLSDMVHASIIE